MSAADALEDALRLAPYRVPAFPCLPDKRPACPHGFKDATSDPEELKQLWARYPGVLVGVPTGEASNFFVLDIDSAKHPEAEEWFERHAPYLPETRLHRTQSGGCHLIFKHQPGLKNSTSKIAPGVDTRGEGGFIIWWPFHLGLDAGHSFLPVAEVPEWLVKELNPAPSPVPAIISPGRPLSSGHAQRKLDGITRTVAYAREGERNAVTHWAACRGAEMVREGAPRNETMHKIIGAAVLAGLSSREAERTVLSAFRKILGA
jgi:hypothetical protein